MFYFENLLRNKEVRSYRKTPKPNFGKPHIVIGEMPIISPTLFRPKPAKISQRRSTIHSELRNIIDKRKYTPLHSQSIHIIMGFSPFFPATRNNIPFGVFGRKRRKSTDTDCVKNKIPKSGYVTSPLKTSNTTSPDSNEKGLLIDFSQPPESTKPVEHLEQLFNVKNTPNLKYIFDDLAGIEFTVPLCPVPPMLPIRSVDEPPPMCEIPLLLPLREISTGVTKTGAKARPLPNLFPIREKTNGRTETKLLKGYAAEKRPIPTLLPLREQYQSNTPLSKCSIKKKPIPSLVPLRANFTGIKTGPKTYKAKMRPVSTLPPIPENFTYSQTKEDHRLAWYDSQYKKKHTLDEQKIADSLKSDFGQIKYYCSESE